MRLAHISWKKVEEYFKTNDTVIIAVGSIENHGTHVGLGTDTLIPDKILELMEDKTDVLIAPTVPYGNADSLADFPGTITIGYDGLYLIMTKITESLYKFGARKFVFLNGHGGNIGALDAVSLDLNRKGALAATFNWWLIAGDLNPAWKGGHGGAEETAAMLAVNPDYVDMDAIEPMTLNDLSENLKATGYKTVEFKGININVTRSVRNITGNGWIGPDYPANATVEWGKDMLETTANYFAEFVNEFSKVKIEK
ncbi:creatininase family protein [Lutispora thermophila]|uniref:Creatinine amidohydrolase n=1 Tax=Lutispora thermophila DSM 19022 TaxID=1122184 RepID=A0A1M6EDY0_9FIRM|nr:creatininase family protein [Lutispora thermophila]SHI83674.1 creatinine amidohydrolase [Lutispora thermophila DSM 19022]